MIWYKIIALVLVLQFVTYKTIAQEDLVYYSKTINTSGYEGHRFRLTATVKLEPSDDSAAARLWVRADDRNGIAFFEAMWRRPIRNHDWKTYSIVGRIGASVYQLAFGALCQYDGKFYYDDFKIDIEKSKDEWENIFTENFENTNNTFLQEVQPGFSSLNKKFTAGVADSPGKGKVLLIEGKDITNYGSNKKVGKFADVNGVKLYYEIYGQGTPLVILHGNGGSIQSASPFLPNLISRYKIIAVDSRAHGKSTTTNEPLTYDMMASDINELLNQLHIDSAFIWGQSDGGILALLLAKDHPEKVKRALAYSPNIQQDSLAVFSWSLAAKHKVVAESHDPKKLALTRLMLDYPNLPYSDLSKIKAPIMIMSGDRDVIRLEHIIKIFQSIPKSQLCILPGSTHGGSWEKEDLFLTIMNDFFTKPFEMPDTKDWLTY